MSSPSQRRIQSGCKANICIDVKLFSLINARRAYYKTYLPFYLSAFRHDSRTHPPCTNVRQYSVRQLMYLMGPQKMAPNNDVHDDVLIDIVVYELEQLLCGVTSNRQMLKHLQKISTPNKSNNILL